jgi:thiol-disulfide isomerase/thioredoxin
MRNAHTSRTLVLLTACALLALPGCLGPSGGPVAVLSSAAVTGPAPLTIGFNLSFSHHPKGRPMTFELDFGDGSDPVRGTEFAIILNHTYEQGGVYEAQLIVFDEDGQSDTDSLAITVDEEGPAVGLDVGNLAPDFTGHVTSGGQMSLSDYLGHVVVLDFWGAWCAPCKNSMPHLDGLVKAYADQNLVAIVVSTDLVEQDAVDFLTSGGYTQFVSVWEPGGKNGNPIDALYDVTQYPTTFVIDKQGVIRWVGHPLHLTGAMIEVLL